MISEEEILNTIKTLVPNSSKFLSDDCAIVPIGKENFVLTTDTLSEGQHFTIKKNTFSNIGWKSMAVNLSDISSMGAKPLYALISLSIPKKIKKIDLKNLYSGIQECAKKYKTQIIGGNITSADLLSITITLVGVSKGKTIGKRCEAKAGDIVFVSGFHGDSKGGFELLKKKYLPKNRLIKKHLRPNPQIKIGELICKSVSRASLMDSSDGLADCILKISSESNVQINIEEDLIPISKELATKFEKHFLHFALYGGEDYELVGTVSKKDWEKIKKLNLHKIGTVKKGKGSYLVKSDKKMISLRPNLTFQHFK